MDWEAVSLTLRLAASATLVLVALGIPLAWWIASGRSAGRSVLQALVALPLLLPPTVIGFYLLVGMGPLHWPGRLLTAMFGHPLAFSFAGLLVGSIVYSLPFAVQPMVSGFRSVGQEFGDAATGLGMSPVVAFRQVVLPLARGSVLTAAVLCFTHTIGEFGVVLMLGGNIPGVTRTLSITLFDRVQDFDYAGANREAAVLVLVAMLGLLAVYGRWARRGVDLGQG